MKVSWILCIILFILFVISVGLCIREHRRRNLEIDLSKKKEEEQNSKIHFYEKIVPLAILEAVYTEKSISLSDMEPIRMKTVIMDINTDEFLSVIRKMNTAEMFHFINEFLKDIIPVVYKNHGQIDKFYSGGFMAYFEDSYEDALVAAILMVECITKKVKSDVNYESFSIGLCYGTVYAGMVGNDQRYALLSVSEYTGLATFLRCIGRKYHSRILVTQTYLSGISAIEKKFHSRFIGYLYLSKKDTLEKIYDVFDGDSIEIRNRKRKTKIVFEKGVSFFVNGDYQKAREYFIEVLKSDRSDKAAKEYLSRLDEYFSKKEEKKMPVYIEAY